MSIGQTGTFTTRTLTATVDLHDPAFAENRYNATCQTASTSTGTSDYNSSRFIMTEPQFPDSDQNPAAGSQSVQSTSRTARASSLSPETQIEETGPLSSSAMLARTLIAGNQPTSQIDLTNCMLGEFRLLRRLGSGGMAQVYLADQTSLHRHVAIKIMRPDFGGNDTYQKRFEHEARAAAGLNHPNIVQVFAVGEEGGIRYIAQEYVHGLNLRQFLQRRKPPTSQVALHLMKQCCSALNAAHQAGIVHRDIKPENIMVTRRMVVKVTDFGLAQLTLDGNRVNLTQMGQTMGTPLYMSPEQINDANVDARSDLYSLGVTFYHLLSGEPPFNGPTAVSLAYKHLHEDADPLQKRRPDLAPSFVRLIHRLMAKEPAQRYSDAKSVLAELKRIEKSGETGAAWADEDAAVDVISESFWHVSRARLKAYGIACLIVLVISSGLGRQARRTDPLDAPVTAEAEVPRQATAAAQVTVARTLARGGNPERVIDAWQVVLDRFPDAKLARLEAHRELGILLLKQRRYDEALEHFDELTRQNDNHWKADGVAGQAAVASLTDRFEVSHELLVLELSGLADNLSESMRPLVQMAIRRNSSHRGSRDEELEQLFAPETEPEF
ncbi:protein kinase [bacterium]|nr:protein kinase [bacterium]